jgi:hypothetical protein
MSAAEKECYFCHSTKAKDTDAAAPVDSWWVITKAVFGMPQRVVVCFREACMDKAREQGYKFQGYGRS